MNFKVIANGAAHMMIKRFMGPFWIRRKWLKKTQWLSASELEAIRLKLLQRLVQHCYSTVPYYKRLMDRRGISVDSIRTLEDIEQFPILTKTEVLNAGDSLISTKYPKWVLRKARTGGTTGTPIQLRRSLFSIGNEHAFVRRQWDWANIGFNDRSAWIVAGRRLEGPNQMNCCLYAYDPFMKELTLSIYHLSPKTAKEYAELVINYKVKAIVGISSAVYFLAKVCSDFGINVKLKAVLTTSETITDTMRRVITDTFGCQVFDYYGAAERVCYIHTCEKGSYHILPEYGLTELIPIEDSDSNQCRIIATGFWNLGMPLIRYNTEDIVVKSDTACSCGRAFTVVKSISGRESDLIKTPSERIYGPTLLARAIKGGDNILETQVIQDALDHIYVLYIPSKNFSEKDLRRFKNHLSHYLPSELNIDLKCVTAIPKTASGKTRLIVSEI